MNQTKTPTPPKKKKKKKKPRKWRRNRHLSFTQDGKYFFWITLGVGFAAINTGNNLLYLLLGMLLSLIIISGILSELSLQKLELKRTIPQQLFADTTSLITLTVTNKKRFFPSFSIEIEDRIEGYEKGKKCYFLKLSPNREQKTAYRLVLPRRGQYAFREMIVSTGFPFSLFVKSRRYIIPEEFIAYPCIRDLAPPKGGTHLKNMGQKNTTRKGSGINFFSLRELQPGDEVRKVHWPSSARSQQLQVREFEDEHRPEVELLLWNAFPEEKDLSPEELDPVVEIAASYLADFLKKGQPVRFASATAQFPPLNSRQLFYQILHHLALLEAVYGHQAPPALQSSNPLVLVSHQQSAPPLAMTPIFVEAPPNPALSPDPEPSPKDS